MSIEFNSNEYMFFRPALLYALIYGITGKYMLSQSITLTISFILIILSYYFFSRAVGVSRKNIIIGVLLLFSFCGSDTSFNLIVLGRPFQVLTFLCHKCIKLS